MLPEWNSYTWGIDRQRAVELLEDEVNRAFLERQECISLPVFAAQVILECARNGQHRGQGRKRPRESENDRISRQAIILYARQRWAELGWKRGTKQQAAQEVLNEDRGGGKLLGKLVNLTSESLVQLMGPKPKS